MSIIVSVRVPSSSFELGRALKVQDGARVELETLVPLGESAIPLFWAHTDDREEFVASASSHPSVRAVTAVETFDDRTLFALDWETANDGLLGAVVDCEGHLLAATGVHGEWRLELRFPGNDELGAFRRACQEAAVSLDVERVFRPDGSETGSQFGLTAVQRETLLAAVEAGYYDIPRRCSTAELAEELGVSDQAVTERLRRAVVSLVSNALLASETG